MGSVWVSNGIQRALTLTAGRAYPVRLEFSRAFQGVGDADKKNEKKPIPPAFVKLLWKRPKLAAQLIPKQFLIPTWSPEKIVVETSFPADDRSIGYERGTSVSKTWDEATTEAAIEIANKVTSRIAHWTGIPDNDPARKESLKAYSKRLLVKAFRAPITSEIERVFVDKQFEAAASPEMGLKRVILLALKSPRFLLREPASQKKDGYAIAADLSFGLWDSLPDAKLLAAAEKGELSTPEQIQTQAERLTKDERAWFKLRDFLLGWLKVDEAQDVVKNPKSYPGFELSTSTDLRTSLELFLESVAKAPESDYRQLMTSKTLFANGSLAKFYGVQLPPTASFQPVSFEPEKRAGVLTHPYILSRFAYLDGTSPIHRGVMVLRGLLGRTLQPPPAAFTPLPAELHPNMTTRERVAKQTQPSNCSSCHAMINPLGFTLENFDAVGRVRKADAGKPVDTSGGYLTKDGKRVTFKNATELASFIANSDEAHAAFVEKLFHHVVKQPIRAYGKDFKPQLEQAFSAGNFNMRKLIVRMITDASTTIATPSK